jgi:hypothetical protein
VQILGRRSASASVRTRLYGSSGFCVQWAAKERANNRAELPKLANENCCLPLFANERCCLLIVNKKPRPNQRRTRRLHRIVPIALPRISSLSKLRSANLGGAQYRFAPTGRFGEDRRTTSPASGSGQADQDCHGRNEVSKVPTPEPGADPGQLRNGMDLVVTDLIHDHHGRADKA